MIPDTGKRDSFGEGRAIREVATGKGLPSLIPTRAMRRLATRLEDGAVKYSRNNWKKGMPLSRYIDSLMRHLWAFQENDETEDHLGAMIFNVVALSETFDMIEDGILPKEFNDIHNE
jgi:hypothetical protein